MKLSQIYKSSQILGIVNLRAFFIDILLPSNRCICKRRNGILLFIGEQLA